MSDDAGPGRAIRRMQAAAVERSLVDGETAEPYLVLAGALEGARVAAGESDLADTTATTPAMTATLALFGVSRLSETAGSAERPPAMGPPTPPMPPSDDRRERLRVRGARVALDLGACSRQKAAALAGVSEAAFEVEDRTAGVTGDR